MLVVIFALFYCLLDLRVAECNVITLYVLCVACLTVFLNYLVKQFAICFGVVVILLLNVMELYSMFGGALLNRPYAAICSFHMFFLCVCLYVGSYLII